MDMDEESSGSDAGFNQSALLDIDDFDADLSVGISRGVAHDL